MLESGIWHSGNDPSISGSLLMVMVVVVLVTAMRKVMLLLAGGLETSQAILCKTPLG